MYDDATKGVVVNLATGAAADRQRGTDSLSGIEGVVGGCYVDNITLGAIDDFAVGRAGNDRLLGGSGNDVLNGGSGADRIDGAGGTDTASYIDDGSDGAGVGTSGVTVDLATGKATDNWGGADTLGNV